MCAHKIVIVLLFVVLWNEIDCSTRRGRNSRTQDPLQPTGEASTSRGDEENTQTTSPNRVTNVRTHLGNIALLARRPAERNQPNYQEEVEPQYDQQHNVEHDQTRQNEPGEVIL
ncbi:unnamed protein product [Meloidogyne enterolobii]|uniref:Uncharacterized protein n=1 Tax=Meloidogyne enterolobii TaxID=390850 RepID=A0ACB1A2U3_MELEN